MILLWKDVRPIWEQLLETIYEDRTKLKRCTPDERGEGRITALRLEQAICNHLFGDSSETFGITPHDAQRLRDYVQESLSTGNPYEYVELLHKEFPQFMDPEESGYLKDHVNPARIRAGLQPLNL